MQDDNISKGKDVKVHGNEGWLKWTSQSSNVHQWKKKEKMSLFHPSLVPVSAVAEEKYLCSLLIWGWLRKGGMREGGKGGRREEETEERGTGELREVYRVPSLCGLRPKERREEGMRIVKKEKGGRLRESKGEKGRDRQKEKILR